jgi:hypothetical protein
MMSLLPQRPMMHGFILPEYPFRAAFVSRDLYYATSGGIIRAKLHFCYFGHGTFHSWVLANTSMLPFVVTVPPPWRAW